MGGENKGSGFKSPVDYRELSHQILHYANRNLTRTDFLREVLKILMNFSGCNTVELQVKDGGKLYLYNVKCGPELSFRVDFCKRSPVEYQEQSTHEKLRHRAQCLAQLASGASVRLCRRQSFVQKRRHFFLEFN